MLNLSLSSRPPQSYKTDPLDAAVEYAWQKGIVVVAAAGNRGVAGDAVKYAQANDPFVISVGGIDETANYGQGKRADWSSTGTTQDGVAKPEVLAPGAHIVSVLAPSSAFPAAVPELRHRRRVLQGRRHLDGRSGSSPAPPPCCCRPAPRSPPTRSRRS